MGTCPPLLLPSVGDGESGSCICFVLILLMRETALIARASFDPQQKKQEKKKRLSYVDGPLFLSPTSLSLGSSLASLPRRSVMSEDEVNEVVQGGMQHTWKSDLTRLWSKLECDSFVLLANSLHVKMHMNAYTKHRCTQTVLDPLAVVRHFVCLCLSCAKWGLKLNKKTAVLKLVSTHTSVCRVHCVRSSYLFHSTMFAVVNIRKQGSYPSCVSCVRFCVYCVS